MIKPHISIYQNSVKYTLNIRVSFCMANNHARQKTADIQRERHKSIFVGHKIIFVKAINNENTLLINVFVKEMK